MNIKNPRRILFLGAQESGVLSLLKDITGSAPEPRLVPSPSDYSSTASSSSLQEPQSQQQQATLLQSSPTATTAGLTHALSLRNTYYTATIPIWLDEPSSPAEWKADFLAPEAAEVVRALGAWVLVVRTGVAGDARARRLEWAAEMMDAVNEVVHAAYGCMEDAWDGVLLCVGMPLPGARKGSPAAVDEWEDLCWDRSFEFVDASVTGDWGATRDRNGEVSGIRRVVEALEANDWAGDIEAEDEFAFLDDNDDGEEPDSTDEFGAWASGQDEENAGFQLERREMESEIRDLKLAVNGQASEDKGIQSNTQAQDPEQMQVEELERMFGKMLAVRDMTAHMPESERKKTAARAVNDIMKTI